MSFARQYGFAFLCHEKGHPNRKAGEEKALHTVQTNFLPGRQFQSLEDLNAQAFEWSTVRMDRRPLGRTKVIPAEAFEAERAYLVKLPAHLPAPYLVEQRGTDQYGYTSFDGNYYWVPGTKRDEVTVLQYSDRLKKYIVEEEYKTRTENARQRRLKQARIPEMLVVETYPFHKQPRLDKKKILSLYEAFEYMTKIRNIIWVGPTGVGKSGLATGFLIQAINRGYTGRYVLFRDLVDELLASVADHSEQKVVKRYLSYDCLLIDEIGYVEVEPAQVGLFFTLMQKRHRRKPTLITSNLGFSEWRSFLNNDHLTGALIDRLTENSHVINMSKCSSLRAKLSEP